MRGDEPFSAKRDGKPELPAEFSAFINGSDDFDRVAAGRAGSVDAGASVAAQFARQSPGRVGLLRLFGLLDRLGVVAGLVVDVPAALGLGRLPDDACAVLAGVAQSEPRRFVIRPEDRVMNDERPNQSPESVRSPGPAGGLRAELIRRRLEAEQAEVQRRQSGCGGCRGRRITR